MRARRGPAISSPRSLASSEPAGGRHERADDRDRVALGGEAEPPGALGVGQRRPSRSPASGRSARRRPRCRATRCRRRPAPRAPGRPGDALAPPPSAARPRAASRDCRNSGSWSGRAASRPRSALPRTQNTASTAPRGRMRPAGRCRRSRPRSPAVRQRQNGGVGLSGRRTVRDCTTESYCSNTGRREAMLAEPISASSVLPATRCTEQHCRRRPVDGSRPPTRRLEVVERAVVDQDLDRQVGGDTIPRAACGGGASR